MTSLFGPGPVSLPGTILSTTSMDPTSLPESQLPISSPTPSATSVTPIPTPFLAFKPLSDMTACSTGTIGWDASGPVQNLSLAVVNTFVYLPTTLLDRRQDTSSEFHTITKSIATNIDPSLLSYSWSPVSVPEGNYVIIGAVDGLLSAVVSTEFSVRNGTDTSCLLGSPTTPSQSPSPAPSSSSGIETGPTLLPVSGGASSSNHTAGAIAGGVIGGLVIVVALIGAFFFFCVYRSSKRSRRAQGGDEALGKWNGLSSRDSNIHSALPTTAPGARRTGGAVSRTESTGGILSANNSSLGHGVEHTSPIGSDDDLSTLAEKTPVSPRGPFEYIETVAPLSYNARRRSSTSSNPGSPVSPSNAANRPRARSSSQNRAMALAKLDSSTIGPITSSDVNRQSPARTHYSRKRQSLDGRVLSGTIDTPSSPQQQPITPLPMSAEMVPINRSSSGGARRATRKPVPTYTESEFSAPSPVQSEASTAHVNTIYDGANAKLNESPTASSSNLHHDTHYSPVTPPQSHSGHSATNITRERSREELQIEGLELPNLNHKSSFGDMRPMHYLIPDMPPPPRD